MTNFHDETLLSLLVAGLRYPGDTAALLLACDRLEEIGCWTADVRDLYERPPFMDVSYQFKTHPILMATPFTFPAGSLELVGAERVRPQDEDDTFRPLLIAWCQRAGQLMKAERIKEWYVDGFDHLYRNYLFASRVHVRPGSARRELKRRVVYEFSCA
jgi:hypothetical protein